MCLREDRVVTSPPGVIAFTWLNVIRSVEFQSCAVPMPTGESTLPPESVYHVPFGPSLKIEVSWLTSENGFGALVMQPDLFHVTKSSE